MDFTDILSQALSNRVNQAMEPFNDPQAYAQKRLNTALEPFNNPEAYAQQRLGITTATNQTNEIPTGMTALAMSPAVANTPTAYTSPVSTPDITTKELPPPPHLAALNQPGLAEALPGTGPDMRMTGPEVQPQGQTRSISAAPETTVTPVTTATVQQPQVQQPQVQQPQPAPQVQKAKESGLIVNAQNPAETSDPTFNSIIKAETNGRHFDANGNIITSKAGAMGLAQIMPATARNPGFGLKPLSEEDIKDPVKNAAFGLQYFNAQKRYFNGDEEKAVAAYNAGAGNVNKAIKMAQQQGGDWRDYLPAETKAYLPKVMGNRKPIEGAVADHIEQTTGERPTELQGAGMRGPGGATVEQYQALNSKDPEQLTKLVYGLSTPPAIQRQALEQLHSDIKYQNTMNKIEAEFPSIASNPTAITRKMNDKEEGSYFKAYLFARLGLNDLAAQEQEKISPTRTTMPVMLGNDHYSATYNKYGELLSARDEQGRLVNDATLAKISANAFASKGATTGQSFMKDANNNIWSHTVTPGTNRVIWTNQTTGETQQTAPTGLTPFGQINPVTRANISLASSAERMMINRNDKDRAAGLTPTYSQEMIDAEKERILNGAKPTIAIPSAPAAEKAPAPAAPAQAVAEKPAAAVAQPTTPTAPVKGAVEARGTPPLEAMAQSIYNGDMPMPTGMGANNARNQWLASRVQEIAQQKNKAYDPTVYTVRKKTEESFSTGKQGDTVKSMNVAIDHLDTLQSAANALNNGQLPIFNDIANKFAKNTGQPQITDFNSLKSIVGSEVAKAVAGGATALGDREEIRREIDAANSPQQLAGVITRYQQLLSGQMKGLKTQYESGGGKNWDTKLNPRTKEILEKPEGGAKATNTRSNW